LSMLADAAYLADSPFAAEAVAACPRQSPN
jgi:hypothetical protein